MRHPDLRSFLDTLRREGELRIIEEPVDPCLELAEVQRRTVALRGPALLFTKVRGTAFPVATNLFGTRRRIDLAFGEEPSRWIARLVSLAESRMPPPVAELWKQRDFLRTGSKLGLKLARTGPVLDCRMEPPLLTRLPQIQSWPSDGGPFLTLPLAYTEHPLTGNGNLGMYRNQIYDDSTLGMHFQIHRGGGFHYFEAEKLNRPLAANIFLGGPPALFMSAVAPLPENVPELVFASLLLGGKMPVIRDRAVSPLPVPARAEFAIIGRIPPQVRRLEGPFGDHYGYYSMQHDFPVLEVDRIWHRKDAIFPATVVGRPPQEDHYIGEYLQELFAPLYPLVMNGVSAVRAYDEAGMHPLAAAVVRERYRREAFMAALRILGEGQLSLTKFLLVTDAALDLREIRAVLIHVLERADFATDLYIFSNVSQDTLDHTSRKMNEGSKALLMGLGEKRFHLPTEPCAGLRNDAFRRQGIFAPGILVVEGPRYRPDDEAARELLLEEAVRPFRLVCLVDDASECLRDQAAFLWTVFTRFEPAADLYSRSREVVRHHLAFSAPLVLDCRLKPWYPPVVEPHPDTVARVDTLWPRIFPDGLPGD